MIIETKIRIPEANPNITQRLSLFEKLNSGLLINDIHGFLLQTSLLEKLSGPLCDVLLERDDSQLILESPENNPRKSPYVIIDASLKGIICGSFIMFILLFIGSLFLGRAFCLWACPIGGAQEMLSRLKTKYAKKGKLIKWFIWVPWIMAIIIVAFRAGGYQEIDPFYRTSYGFSLGNIYTLIAYLSVLALVLIPYFTVGKRSFYRHLCWISPFMILGRRIQTLLKTPSLKLVKTV